MITISKTASLFAILTLTSCSAAVSYSSPTGQLAKVEWAVAVPVVNTNK